MVVVLLLLDCRLVGTGAGKRNGTPHTQSPHPRRKAKAPSPVQRFAVDSRRRNPRRGTDSRTDTDRRPSIDCQHPQQNQHRRKRRIGRIIIIIISQQRVSVLCVDDRPAAKSHSLTAAIRVQIHQQQRILDGRNGAHKEQIRMIMMMMMCMDLLVKLGEGSGRIWRIWAYYTKDLSGIGQQ
ncbi:hypothetical protein niasHT_023960 [Heterodera trifolii]|uniref:Secreted protein n=1 Tax=Heterodera trifolii TaxID=157864 RepID=A0ABD2JVJ0_9BILA